MSSCEARKWLFLLFLYFSCAPFILFYIFPFFCHCCYYSCCFCFRCLFPLLLPLPLQSLSSSPILLLLLPVSIIFSLFFLLLLIFFFFSKLPMQSLTGVPGSPTEVGLIYEPHYWHRCSAVSAMRAITHTKYISLHEYVIHEGHNPNKTYFCL